MMYRKKNTSSGRYYLFYLLFLLRLNRKNSHPVKSSLCHYLPFFTVADYFTFFLPLPFSLSLSLIKQKLESLGPFPVWLFFSFFFFFFFFFFFCVLCFVIILDHFRSHSCFSAADGKLGLETENCFVFQ